MVAMQRRRRPVSHVRCLHRTGRQVHRPAWSRR
jgi:hypothetical protein